MSEAETGSPLAEWLGRQFGPDRRYKSARHLSLRAGLSPNTVSRIIERGRGDPETLIQLAGTLGVPATRLFILAGWLSEADLAQDLSADEARLLARYRALPARFQRLLLGVAEELLQTG